MLKKFLLASALIVGLTAAAPAFADREDVATLAKAKISLVEAVQAAEKSVGGKAIDADLDDNGQFEVNVVKGDSTWEVYVNATDGTIMRSVEDKD